MKIIAATPDPRPVPAPIRAALEAISPAGLRADVERIAVPRVHGTPENKAVRRLIRDRFAEIFGEPPEADEAGNVVAGDPRYARILVGAHYDAVLGTIGAETSPASSAAFVRSRCLAGWSASVSANRARSPTPSRRWRSPRSATSSRRPHG